MKTFAVKVERSGRILIPASVRRHLKLVEGESQVLLTVDDAGEIQVRTREQALARVRAELRTYVPEGTDLAAELIADRRREAAQEDAQ